MPIQPKDKTEKIEKLIDSYRTYPDTKLIELYALIGEHVGEETREAYETVLKERGLI